MHDVFSRAPIQRYLIAVSGGIDSVVLLDKMVRAHVGDIVVAHFDHGIREDSAADARFVAALAKRYGVSFVVRREELGARASEERARVRRYSFLEEQAKEHSAALVTAHHADDIIETIAINVSRGTGWRGVAVLNNIRVMRPLLSVTKDEIRQYALTHRLEWVEDSTNATSDYLRNRIRALIAERFLTSQKQSVLVAWKQQLRNKIRIDEELQKFINRNEYSRYFFVSIDSLSAAEILRAAIVAKTLQSPTRPQIDRALIAIKTAASGTLFEVGGGVTLRFTIRTFIVEIS